jgi:hypothetical protein
MGFGKIIHTKQMGFGKRGKSEKGQQCHLVLDIAYRISSEEEKKIKKK